VLCVCVCQGDTPLYWRITYHGTGGVLVCQSKPATCEVWSNTSPDKITLAASPSVDSLVRVHRHSRSGASVSVEQGDFGVSWAGQRQAWVVGRSVQTHVC
jgi:hypothetical protein